MRVNRHFIELKEIDDFKRVDNLSEKKNSELKSFEVVNTSNDAIESRSIFSYEMNLFQLK